MRPLGWRPCRSAAVLSWPDYPARHLSLRDCVCAGLLSVAPHGAPFAPRRSLSSRPGAGLVALLACYSPVPCELLSRSRHQSIVRRRSPGSSCTCVHGIQSPTSIGCRSCFIHRILDHRWLQHRHRALTAVVLGLILNGAVGTRTRTRMYTIVLLTSGVFRCLRHWSTPRTSGGHFGVFSYTNSRHWFLSHAQHFYQRCRRIAWECRQEVTYPTSW
jgi:hypothetical protein